MLCSRSVLCRFYFNVKVAPSRSVCLSLRLPPFSSPTSNTLCLLSSHCLPRFSLESESRIFQSLENFTNEILTARVCNYIFMYI